MKEETKKILNELKGKLPIDQFGLEVECRNQPSLLEEMGEIVAEVKRTAKVAKEHLEYVRAGLSDKIRKNPEICGLVKATETAISSAIVLQSEYQKAFIEMVDAEEEANVFSILLMSVEQRKSLIRDLVTLYVDKYYSLQNMDVEQKVVGKITEAQIVNQRQRRAEQKEKE